MLRKEDISIIVVDDLQFSCEVVKSGLKKAGYKDVRTANSANEAMLQLQDQRADVVLADFWMPEMNGLELTDLIRRWDENNNRYTGIILLTAEDTTSSMVVAFDHGVDDFLSKSANQFELAARVFGAGRTARMQNDIRRINMDLIKHYHTYNQLSMVDRETGLANRKHLERSLDSMISHCENRGGGIGVCLIRVDVDETEEHRLKRIRSGTLRTISNSLQLVLRPMDQIARYDDNTFAIALIYTDPASFDIGMFERSTRSIFRHTHHVTDQGHPFQLSMATSRWDKFDPSPDVGDLLVQVEQNFFELEPEPA